MDTKRAALIVNTRSRTGRQQFDRAVQQLRDHGIEVRPALAHRNTSALLASVREEVSRRTPLIVVGGGDGTLGAAAALIARSRSTLGVLPLGTGNQFARDLGIAAELDEAVKVIAGGRVACVDMGQVNENRFLTVATIGLSVMIARELTDEAKRRLGKWVYVAAMFRAMVRIRPFEVTLETDGEKRTLTTLQVVIGNGRFHAGPFPLAPDACLNAGRLIVYAIEGASKWHLFRYALSLPGGHHVDLPFVPVIHAGEGQITTGPSQRIVIDGEIAGKTPIRFKSDPQALQVMVPEAFEG